jgi:hypothetical protein
VGSGTGGGTGQPDLGIMGNRRITRGELDRIEKLSSVTVKIEVTEDDFNSKYAANDDEVFFIDQCTGEGGEGDDDDDNVSGTVSDSLLDIDTG